MNLRTNPELIPLIEWWEKDGKQMVMWLVVAAIAVGGWYGWKNHVASVKAAAADALVSAYTTEEIEDAVVKYGDSDAGCVLKLRLAKSYFDAGRYDEALVQYEGLFGRIDAAFAEIPVIGKAQCLEATGKFAEAKAAFEAFVAEHAKHYLTLTAQLGAARCTAQAGDRQAALEALKSLKEGADDLAKARIEATETLIKRMGKASAPEKK